MVIVSPYLREQYCQPASFSESIHIKLIIIDQDSIFSGQKTLPRSESVILEAFTETRLQPLPACANLPQAGCVEGSAATAAAHGRVSRSCRFRVSVKS